MRHSIVILVLLSLLSCAHQAKKEKQTETPPVDVEKKLASFSFDDWLTINKTVPVGEVTTLVLPSTFPSDYKVSCDGTEVLVGAFDHYKVGFVSVEYGAKVGRTIVCKAIKEQAEKTIAYFKVVDKKFPAERINVDKKRVFLSKKALKRVRKEQVFLNSNYFNPSTVPFFDEGFIVPLNSYITSIYGSRRVFNKKKFTKHLGTDFRAAIGTPIPAANAGKVVVSRDLFYTGLTVTIDHGLGIFTVYGHLSKLLVKEGDMVTKGQTLALSGNTGRTSGPHLHWGIKIHNRYIDGHSLVKVTQDL